MCKNKLKIKVLFNVTYLDLKKRKIIQWKYSKVFNVNNDHDTSEYDSWWYVKIYKDRYINTSTSSLEK